MFERSAAILLAMYIAPVTLAFAQDAPVATTQQPMSVYDKMALVVLPDSMIDPQINSILNTMILTISEKDPNFKDMEKKYPGLSDNFISTLKPVFDRIVREVLPMQRADLSKLYAANLSANEAKEAILFLQSPAMQKFKNKVSQNGIDFKNTVAEAIDKENASPTSLQKDMSAAGARAGASMTQAETLFLNKFMASPLWVKWSKLSPQKIAIDTKWFNYTTPEYDRAIAEASIEGMAGHIEKTDKELGKLMREEMRKSLSKNLSSN
jgi:hypothetical protein